MPDSFHRRHQSTWYSGALLIGVAAAAWLGLDVRNSRAALTGWELQLAAPILTAGETRRPEVLLNSAPFHARGWVTVTVPRTRKYEQLILEVTLPPTLPASAHLHVVATPIMPRARSVATAAPHTDLASDAGVILAKEALEQAKADVATIASYAAQLQATAEIAAAAAAAGDHSLARAILDDPTATAEIYAEATAQMAADAAEMLIQAVTAVEAAQAVLSAAEEAFSALLTSDMAFGRWPQTNVPPSTASVTEEWFDPPASSWAVFQNGRYSLSAPYQAAESATGVNWVNTISGPLRLAEPGGVVLKPLEGMGFPTGNFGGHALDINGSFVLASNSSAIGALWCHKSHGPLAGREAPPGESLLLTLALSPAWTGVRLAFAPYHQNATTGKEETFWTSAPSGGMKPADQYDYPNDPYFLARPWAAAGQQSSWLTNWRFLEGDPYGLGPRYQWGGDLRWAMLAGPGRTSFQYWSPYDAAALLPWTSLVGRETARWMLAWSTNFCELDRWHPSQRVPTNLGLEEPMFTSVAYGANRVHQWTNFNSLGHQDGRHAILPSHALLADWGHLAWSARFQSAPFFPINKPETGTKRWILPVHQADLHGHAATALPPTPLSGPDPFSTYRNDPIYQQLRNWPAVWETNDRALQIGSSCHITLNASGSPFLWQPTLPPMFNQWECWSAPDWMNMILYARGALWDGIRGQSDPAFYDIISELEGIPHNYRDYTVPYDFYSWWDWLTSFPPHRWSGPQPQVMPLSSASIALLSLFPADPIEMLQFNNIQGLPDPGLPRLSQPLFTLPTATYPVERLRITGLPR